MLDEIFDAPNSVSWSCGQKRDTQMIGVAQAVEANWIVETDCFIIVASPSRRRQDRKTRAYH